MKTVEVLRNLEAFHEPKDWAFFAELRIGTGFGQDKEQRFDAWAVNFFTSKRNTAVCYEIKVSRADFFSEIKKPKKRRAGLRLSNQFYFVVPKGLVKVEEVPPECGLIEAEDDGTIAVVIEAPYRDDSEPSWLFIASIARRVDRERQDTYLRNKVEREANKLYTTASSIVLDRYIDKWAKYSLGSKEIPDKILEELKLVRAEILGLVKDTLSF